MPSTWPRRIGTRLSLSYILLLVGAMAIFTAGTCTILFFQMRGQIAHFAVEDIETVEGLMSFSPDGRLIVRDDYHNHPESKRVLEHYLEVLTPQGNVLYRNDRLGGESMGGAIQPSEGVGGYSPRSARLGDGTRVIMVSRRHHMQGRTIVTRLAHSEEPVWHALRQLLIAAALMFPIMIGVGATAGIRTSHRILAPVKAIANQAERITSSSLHERIPVNGGGDELDQLAEVFNRTLTRLEQSFRQLRQFTSDASHELRTPLAAMRSIGEVGLARDGERREYRDLVGSMLEEVNRLTRLVDDLLMISRGDAGAIPLNCRATGLGDLLRETISLLEPLAEEKGQRLELSGENATVQVDPIFLRQAFINLLDNAIKYSPVDSVIDVHVGTASPRLVSIAIHDQGPGISQENAARIFDRFYRVDYGRSREAGGFGLGLSIAQWAVQAHKGTIDVVSAPGAGSTFRISLPV